MRLPLQSPIARIGVRQDRDEPDAVVGPRPRGSRRLHTDAKVAGVRRLVEQTTLTYGEIAQRTGVGRASICRWTREGGWQRPAFAPRSPSTTSASWRTAPASIPTSSARRWIF